MFLLKLGMSILVCLGMASDTNDQITSRQESEQEIVQEALDRIEESLDARFGPGTFKDLQEGKIEIIED